MAATGAPNLRVAGTALVSSAYTNLYSAWDISRYSRLIYIIFIAIDFDVQVASLSAIRCFETKTSVDQSHDASRRHSRCHRAFTTSFQWARLSSGGFYGALAFGLSFGTLSLKPPDESCFRWDGGRKRETASQWRLEAWARPASPKQNVARNRLK